jgi:hypothetical protein
MDADNYTARISLTPQPHREYVKNVEEEEAIDTISRCLP